MNAANKEEFTRVQRVSDRKYNLIDANGKLLSDEWFEWIDYFHDGLAKVQRAYEKYNYIGKDGKLLSNEWFNYVYDFNDGFGEVQRTNGEWAKIDKTGKLYKD